MIFLQTKPSVESLNINYYDLYYTVFKKLADEENEKYEISDDLFQALFTKLLERRNETESSLLS